MVKSEEYRISPPPPGEAPTPEIICKSFLQLVGKKLLGEMDTIFPT
jgi:hypothetical protein